MVRKDKSHRVTPGEHRRSFVANSAVSTVMLFAVTNVGHGAMFVDDVRPVPRMALEAAAILALYDLGYYLLHRFVFHAWTPGARIHAVHHRIRTPYTKDSLYIHPLETFLGLGLFLLCTWVVGAVSVWSFAAAFIVYSLLNVFIHSAFHWPGMPILSAMSHHHDLHHATMKGGYYASITPLWDIVFGTARG
jgi:sterol desaturase/sphingolipid hydroxylase (fatty acid hydroxylase superfamily)